MSDNKWLTNFLITLSFSIFLELNWRVFLIIYKNISCYFWKTPNYSHRNNDVLPLIRAWQTVSLHPLEHREGISTAHAILPQFDVRSTAHGQVTRQRCNITQSHTFDVRVSRKISHKCRHSWLSAAFTKMRIILWITRLQETYIWRNGLQERLCAPNSIFYWTNTRSNCSNGLFDMLCDYVCSVVCTFWVQYTADVRTAGFLILFLR